MGQLSIVYKCEKLSSTHTPMNKWYISSGHNKQSTKTHLRTSSVARFQTSQDKCTFSLTHIVNRRRLLVCSWTWRREEEETKTMGKHLVVLVSPRSPRGILVVLFAQSALLLFVFPTAHPLLPGEAPIPLLLLLMFRLLLLVGPATTGRLVQAGTTNSCAWCSTPATMDLQMRQRSLQIPPKEQWRSRE